MYQYIHEDDENTFQLVDSTRLPKPAYQKRTRFQQNVCFSHCLKTKIERFSFDQIFSVFVNNKLKMVDLHRCKKRLVGRRKNRKR